MNATPDGRVSKETTPARRPVAKASPGEVLNNVSHGATQIEGFETCSLS
jgi:hypothetical protein